MKVTDLTIGESLTIQKGNESITWSKVRDSSCVFVYNRKYFKDSKLVRESDNRIINQSDNEELAFCLSMGFKRV